MHLIGVNGFKRSGKGTVANIVSSLYGDGDANVLQVGFADKVKILGARALGHTDISEAECIALMDQAKESWVISAGESTLRWRPDRRSRLTGREYLQNIGLEARKIFGENFWIDMVLPDPIAVEGWPSERATLLDRRYPGVDAVVITDLRFANEAQRVKALGGVVWEVVRPGTSSDGHDSELVLPRELVDWQINNDGDLYALEARVEEAMSETW